MYKAIRPRNRHFILYLLPGVAIYLFVVFVPVLGAVYYSLYDWSGGPNKAFVGGANYLAMVRDGEFWQAFGNNILLTAVCIVGQIGLAFILAMVLSSRGVYAKRLHRTASYFPATLSAVVIGFIWSMMYDYNYGLINSFLETIGFEDLVQPWLSNRDIALLLVAIPLVWQYVGYYLIIISSAIASIDGNVLEMAEIDGAKGWQRAVYITLPMIKNTMIVCLTLCISGNMRAFDHIYVMTGGGPGTSTNVMALYAYNTSFLRYKMGYGSALSIGILVLSLVVTLISRRLASGKGEVDVV